MKAQKAEKYAMENEKTTMSHYSNESDLENASTAGWDASTKERDDEVIRFFEWLNANRWFDFDGYKWRYTFEMGTSLSKESYEKNYVKTTAQLLEKFRSLPPSPPKE